MFSDDERALEQLCATLVTATGSGELQQRVLDLLVSNIRLIRSVIFSASGLRERGLDGASDAAQLACLRARQVAATQTTVLIRGEPGTGKERLAYAIHCGGPRADRPFVRVNCAAWADNPFESELFGCADGAGARRVGRVEAAQGGTLFLDEVGVLSPALQAVLLRVLQAREFRRVGGGETRTSDARVIASTSRDLEEAMRSGAFRADLYYRLNAFSIQLPPLRERPGDLRPLAVCLAEKYADQMTKPVPELAEDTVRALARHTWPGNVRELENCIEYAVLQCGGARLLPEHLPQALRPAGEADAGLCGDVKLKSRVHDMERSVLLESLKRQAGNVCAVAREVGLTPRMVRYKLRNLNIDPRQFSARCMSSARGARLRTPHLRTPAKP